jgi:hypothetical protein
MDEVAALAAGTGVPGGDALAALRWGWGEAYRIGWDPVRGWWAARRDGKSGDITAGDEDQLWRAIVADYAACPVPRDLAGEP